MQIELRLLIGLAASGLIGLLAYWRGSLTRSGALGAIIVGTTIFGFGGWAAGLTLIAFFVSSSLLSHFKENNVRKQRAAEMFEKGGRRDLWQALANGGAAAIFAVMYGIAQLNLANPIVNYIGLVSMSAMLGALATVNADTWATELGVLSRSSPRLLTTLKVVQPGTSGAITAFGSLAALAGAAFVTIFFCALVSVEYQSTRRVELRSSLGLFEGAQVLLYFLVRVVLVFVSAGFLGSLFDSFLGATVQAMYYSDARQKETEKAYERDGTPNRPLRGWKWMNNDWVNFISSVFGGLIAALLSVIIFR